MNSRTQFLAESPSQNSPVIQPKSRYSRLVQIVATSAFVVGCLLAGVSWILYKFGLLRAELALAGIAKWLLSLTFLIAGIGALHNASRLFTRQSEPLWSRAEVAILVALAGTFWIIIGIKGLGIFALWDAIFATMTGFDGRL